MEAAVTHLRRTLARSIIMLVLLVALPITTPAQTQMSKVKHVFIILMENHNWTGDNSAASSGSPDLSGNTAQAPYINSLIPLRAHAEQYFNPPGNHPSLPNYLWLEAGTNFGILNDNLPTRKNGHLLNGQTTTAHLVTQLENHVPTITWKAYAEPDFPNSDFIDCPQDFNEVDVNHVAFAYFSDTTDGFSSSSPNCIAHVRPYSQLARDLASKTACTPALITSGNPCFAQYNFITPNLCHDGHEGVSPCAPNESADNTLRADTWLKDIGIPAITRSKVYKTDGALFILWDEAEDGGSFSDGPIGMFVLSPFAKTNYDNTIHYDHSSMLKTFQEIFGVTPLLGGAADPDTNDLSDFFLP
jgi:phosphatidylinositol-3-phosphatase